MIRALLYTIISKIVEHHPYPFKFALLKSNPASFVQELGKWENQSWQNFRADGELKGFEDIVTLFTIGTFNRGIVRLDLDEAALLYKTVNSHAPSVGLEIGRGWGGSTLILAIAVGAGGRLTSIELTPSHDEEIHRVLTSAGLDGRVTMLIGDSTEIQIDEKQFDWVFIDGGHEYDVARSDHERWGRLVRPGGYLIYHDMADARPKASCCNDVVRLGDEILLFQQGVVELWRQAGSLRVLRRTDAEWKTICTPAGDWRRGQAIGTTASG